MPTLFESLPDWDNLWTAWNAVSRKKSTPGKDQISVPAFGRDPETHLKKLRRELLEGSYVPRTLRGVWVPKNDGNWRPCGTPALRDRVAQRAFLNVVVPIIDKRFSNGSHAYRPARSIHTAIAQVEWARDRGKKWVLESDVQKCFESIERPRVMRELEIQLGDECTLKLAALWLENGTDWGGGTIRRETGITQGDLVSPLFCNILLDRFDLALLDKGFRPVRYADDFVVPLRCRRLGKGALEDADHALNDLGLTIARHKTRLTTFEAGFVFLGTLFVGSLAMPRYRGEDSKGGVRYTSGYERKPGPAIPASKMRKRSLSDDGAFLA